MLVSCWRTSCWLQYYRETLDVETLDLENVSPSVRLSPLCNIDPLMIVSPYYPVTIWIGISVTLPWQSDTQRDTQSNIQLDTQLDTQGDRLYQWLYLRIQVTALKALDLSSNLGLTLSGSLYQEALDLLPTLLVEANHLSWPSAWTAKIENKKTFFFL